MRYVSPVWPFLFTLDFEMRILWLLGMLTPRQSVSTLCNVGTYPGDIHIIALGTSLLTNDASYHLSERAIANGMIPRVLSRRHQVLYVDYILVLCQDPLGRAPSVW